MRRLCRAAVLLCCCPLPHALAQVSGSVAVVSDFLYRGVSLSDGAPAVQTSLVYDHASGAYAGVFLSQFQLGPESRRSFSVTSYAGYASRLSSGLAWEAGVAQYNYPSVSDRNYREFFAGVSGSRAGMRLAYSPAYLGLDMRTVYADLNFSEPLSDRIALFIHGGYLRDLDGEQHKADARAGVALSLNSWKLQLAIDGVRFARAPLGLYGRPQAQTRRKLFASAAYRF